MVLLHSGRITRVTFAIVLLTFCFPILIQAQIPGFHFFKENVRLSISSEYLRVEGHYYFTNETADALRFPFVYPFPVDSMMQYPDSISVRVMENGMGKEMEYRIIEGKAVSLGIEAPPHSVREVAVNYRQKLAGSSARYILTTTRSWGRPLEEAEFFIELPHDLEIVSLSYSGFEKWSGEGKVVSHMRKEDFMPDADLVVNWRKKTLP